MDIPMTSPTCPTSSTWFHKSPKNIIFFPQRLGLFRNVMLKCWEHVENNNVHDYFEAWFKDNNHNVDVEKTPFFEASSKAVSRWSRQHGATALRFRSWLALQSTRHPWKAGRWFVGLRTIPRHESARNHMFFFELYNHFGWIKMIKIAINHGK